MRAWDKRVPEIAYLLNPPFCARIMLSAIRAYVLESERSMPFPLVYLILPLVLHKETRKQINSVSRMSSWIKSHPEALLGFSERAKGLIRITNEAYEYLAASGLIEMNGNAELAPKMAKKSLSETKFTEGDVNECIGKAKHVGKWFARSGNVETIYICWGIRP